MRRIAEVPDAEDLAVLVDDADDAVLLGLPSKGGGVYDEALFTAHYLGGELPVRGEIVPALLHARREGKGHEHDPGGSAGGLRRERGYAGVQSDGVVPPRVGGDLGAAVVGDVHLRRLLLYVTGAAVPYGLEYLRRGHVSRVLPGLAVVVAVEVYRARAAHVEGHVVVDKIALDHAEIVRTNEVAEAKHLHGGAVADKVVVCPRIAG